MFSLRVDDSDSDNDTGTGKYNKRNRNVSRFRKKHTVLVAATPPVLVKSLSNIDKIVCWVTSVGRKFGNQQRETNYHLHAYAPESMLSLHSFNYTSKQTLFIHSASTFASFPHCSSFYVSIAVNGIATLQRKIARLQAFSPIAFGTIPLIITE
jgi:hypothetical protein